MKRRDGRKPNKRRLDYQDERLERLALAISSLIDVPPHISDALALAYVVKLRWHTYRNMDDLIGDGDDVERIANWKGVPRGLTKALDDIGYIAYIDGLFYMVDAVRYASENVTKKWKRVKPQGYRDAMARANRPVRIREVAPTPPDPDVVLEDQAMNGQLGLFGDAPEDSGKYADYGKATSKLIAWWVVRYRQKTGHEYHLTGKDRGHLWAITKHFSGDIEQAQLTLEEYLASRDTFHRGWPLGKFFKNFQQFQHAAERRHGNGSQSVDAPSGYDRRRLREADRQAGDGSDDGTDGSSVGAEHGTTEAPGEAEPF